MAKKTDLLEEMKGQARAFRIDRDTIIIYTGRDKSDLHPFVRIGAGDDIPHGILQHIENVVIPESNLWNLGLEMAWQNASLQQGVDHIRYVGGKERVSQVYMYTRISEKDDEYHREKIKLLPYARTSLENVKEKSFITFFTGGNMNVQVNGSKVIDFENYTRSRIGIDKEYDMMIKAQGKMELRGKEGRGFVFYGTEDGKVPSMLWNLDGEGMFMNPLHEYPYVLFENLLSVDNISMVTTSNPYGSGFMEAIRRQNVLKGQIGMYCPFPDHAQAIKKLYANCRLNVIDDAKALPFHKATTYYVSKSGSHGLLSMKMAEKAEEPVKILFPLGLGRKFSKSFDYTKGPFDLEFAAINTKEDVQASKDARLKIHFQGEMKPQSYLRMRLTESAYPAVPNAEYRMLYAEDSHAITNMLIGSLEGSGYEESVHALTNYIISGENDEGKLREILTHLRKVKVPQSIFHRINLHELFRFLKNHSAYDVSVKPIFQKAINRVQTKFGLHRIRVKDLLTLQGIMLEIDVIFDGGMETYLLFRNVDRKIPFALQFPPRSGDFEFMESNYKALLKQQNKVLDKMDTETPGFRAALEMMEKLFEDRHLMSQERNRLGELLSLLGMTFQPPAPGRMSMLMSYLPPSVRNFFAALNPKKFMDSVFAKIEPFVESMRNLRAAYFLIPLFLILGTGFFFLYQHQQGTTSSTTTLSDSSAGVKRDAGDAGKTADGGTSQQSATAPGKESGGFFSSISSWFSGEKESSSGTEENPEISKNGDTADEIAAVSQVSPGEVQSEIYVPGENSIAENPVEVMEFANALASRNGFTPIHNPPSPDLRDPDMVFPGDKLKLPDGRLLEIIRGETIWKVSGIHYKKDFARLLILEKQILSSEYAQKKNITPEIQTQLDYMNRLAVTRLMRGVYVRTRSALAP